MKDYKIGKGKLDPDKMIKKGEVRNPKGINCSPEKRMLKTMTEQSLSEAIQSVFTSTTQEIQELLADPETTVGHRIVLKAALEAESKGNYTKFNEILERVLGKVPFKTDVTSKGEAINKAILTSDDKAEIINQMKKAQDEV